MKRKPSTEATAAWIRLMRIQSRVLDAVEQDLKRAGFPPLAWFDALMELSRILVPINYTREPRFRHDPAYTVPPLPTLAAAAELPGLQGHMRQVAQTELMRGQNRYLAAIGQARRVVAAAS